MKTVLLDNSFLIRLLDRTEPLHENAKKYFKYFLDNKIEMYLSAIAVAEYAVAHDPSYLPLNKVKFLSFDFRDAKTAGEFWSFLLDQRKQGVEQGATRVVVINDCKLLAQFKNYQLDAFITKDEASQNKYILPLCNQFNFRLEFINLNIPCENYFGLQGNLFSNP
jgi:predicted nucleic acid-binding protein